MADKLTNFSNASFAYNNCVLNTFFVDAKNYSDILISRLQLEINSTCSHCLL